MIFTNRLGMRMETYLCRMVFFGLIFDHISSFMIVDFELKRSQCGARWSAGIMLTVFIIFVKHVGIC